MTTCSHCGHRSDQPFPFCPNCGTQQLAGPSGGLIGRLLGGKYRVLAPVGAGSMGTVYVAEHVALRKRVALKILHKELQVGDEAWKRFQREGIAAGQVNHPNAIQIFDFDRTSDGLCYLAMEHVEGENLRQCLEREGPLPAEQALALLRQLLSTLAEAHRHGIVHRDLKPENLMVARAQDGTTTLKVLDFGLSKLVDRPLDVSLLTMSGRVLGTPLYMAPEQWHGEEVDARSDLYAAALILYELLTGRQPFKGSNLTETLIRSTTEPPPSILDGPLPRPLPLDLDAVLQQGLAKAREDRFQSAAEMLAALDAVRLDRVGGSSGAAKRRRPAAAALRRASRGRVPGRRTALAAGAAALALFGGFELLGSGAPAAGALLRDKPRERRTEAERGYLALLDDARDELHSGRAAAALALLDKAARDPCADAEAFLVRGDAFRRQHDLEAAAQDYAEALRRWPRFALAESGRGWIALERGQVDTAAAAFTSAGKMDPGCADAAAGLGAVLLAQGRAEEAATLLAAAERRFPDDAVVQLQRGRAWLVLARFDEAVQSFVQARRRDGSLWQAPAGLAEACLAKGDAAAAEQQLAAALELGEQPALRRRLAELQLARGAFDAASRTLAPALQDARASGDLHVLHGLVEHGRGDDGAAMAALERGLELGAAGPAGVRMLLAQLCLASGRWQDAARHCEEATRLDGRLEKAFVDWGLALFRLEDFPGAAAKFETAVALDGNDLAARHCLGVLYMDYLARPQDAAAQFRAYRELGGGDAHVGEWLQKLER